MRVTDDGAFFSVSVSKSELWTFAGQWPCSGMRDPKRGIIFEYDKRSGDLVDIRGESDNYDQSAVLALSQDAQAYGTPRVTPLDCANCGGPLPEGHGFTSRTRPPLKFCDHCAGLWEALGIGNPKNSRAFLYDDGKGNATTWTGPVMGQIVHKQGPARRRLGAVRYRVRMLDGSLWWGHGPTDCGTYIRLRRMKSTKGRSA